MPAKKKESKKKNTSKVNVKALEAQIGKMQEESDKFRKSTEESLRGADVLANTILKSPELTKAFQDQVAKEYPDMVQQGQTPSQQSQQGTQTPPASTGNTQQNPEVDKRIAGVEGAQRDQVVRDFEESYGITNLKEEERTEARRKIEGYLNEFNTSVESAPLSILRKTLDKAYVGTHAEKLREEGKLEGLAQGRSASLGMMGTVGSQTPESEGGEVKLSPEQTKWAEKLRVDPKKAKDRYAKQDEEKDTPSSSEVKAEKNK